MRATREQSGQHHQVRQREQPLFCLGTSLFRCSRDHTQVTAAREIVQVFYADSRQAGYFCIRKNLLTRLDCNQGTSLSPPLLSSNLFLPDRLEDTQIPCNSRSV